MKENKINILNILRTIFKLSFLEIFIVNLIKSNNRFSKIASKLAPNNYQYKKGSYRYSIINGLKFKLDISDYIGHFYYFGFKDPSIQELLTISKDKSVIFDIGANIGYTALNMAKSNSTQTIYAFEPDSFNFDCLVNNINLNSNSKIHPFQLGFGEKVGKEKLIITTNSNLGENKINANATSNYSWITISTIDHFCSEENINKIDLIKIDVEGYEYNVLKGGESSIEKWRPTLFIELIDANLKLQDSSAKQLVSFLEKYYEHIYDVMTRNKVTSNDNFLNKEIDIVATSALNYLK